MVLSAAHRAPPARPKAPVDGVVSFEADGEVWRLLFSVNALCRLEAQLDPDELAEFLAGGEQAAISVWRTAFAAALGDHHPNLTEAEAGHLMQHIGLAQAGALVAQALAFAFPDPEASGTDRPPRARPRVSLAGRALDLMLRGFSGAGSSKA